MTETETRINAILEVVQKAARGDFSVRVEVSEKNDSFDALAMGINMMMDDISSGIEKEKALNEELKDSQSKIKKKADEWETTFNSISDLIFLLDTENTITRVNTAFAQAMKMKPEEIVGKKCYQLLHKRNSPWPDCPFKITKKDIEAHHNEIDDPNIGIPLLVTVSPILNDKKELVGVVHVAQDITDLKRKDEALMEKISQLEKQQEILMDREKRVVELKKEINALLQELGRGEKYLRGVSQ